MSDTEYYIQQAEHRFEVLHHFKCVSWRNLLLWLQKFHFPDIKPIVTIYVMVDVVQLSPIRKHKLSYL
jgi:hypothetical protein